MKKKSKKKNKKGFTLIELLAVIIILGILLLVAVPAVTRYIDNSRKNTYVNSVKSIVTAISTSVNALEYPSIQKGEGLIIPFSEANLEKGTIKTRSPYAEYEDGQSYVLVTFDGARYNYYVAAHDKAGYAIPLINEKELTTSHITINNNIIKNNIHPMSTIKGTEPFDTDNLTYKFDEGKGNIIKVKMCESKYNVGARVQLKDGSEWYVIQNSDENNKRVSLLSYYHMDTSPSNYGKQTKSKNSPTIAFDGTTNQYENASIKSTVDLIISSLKTNFTINNINYSEAEIKMPELSDFGKDFGQWTGWSFYQNDGQFWIKDPYPSQSGNATAVGVSGSMGAYGVSPSKNTTVGIRIVIKDLLKSNIDKASTKALK